MTGTVTETGIGIGMTAIGTTGVVPRIATPFAMTVGTIGAGLDLVSVDQCLLDIRPRRAHQGPVSEVKATPTPPPEDEKLRAKRAKYEAWKKEREAKKALDEAKAKAKAMALAGKSVAGACLRPHLNASLTSQHLIPF